MTPESMPTDATARIVSVQAGRVAQLGPQGVPSGFVKHVVNGSVHAGKLGLEGDEQADLTVHGGPDKAVYGYALSSYPVWLRDFPQHGALLTPGGLGENLTIEQLDETTVISFASGQRRCRSASRASPASNSLCASTISICCAP
jgi:MOSC domain-containing protein YiiM